MSQDAASDRLARLFDAHAPRLYRLARRLVRQQDDALDLVQETFLRAARAPQAMPADPGQEEAWLVRVLVNIQRDQWRKQAVRQRHQHALEAAPATATDAEAAFIDHALVWQALDRLPPRRRAVIVMHELDGRPLADIAATLGISAITVRWHLSRGRRELARTLTSTSGARHAESDQPSSRRRSDPSRSAAL